MDKYGYLPFYVLRKPILPINKILQVFNTAKSMGETDAALRNMFKSKKLQEAIFFASPQLYHRLQKWLLQPERNEKLTKTLLKYAIRSSTRATPYGTFAGCITPGEFGDKTAIDWASIEKEVILQPTILAQLYQLIEQEETLRQYIKFYPNDTLYICHQRLRYLTFRDNDGERQYTLCSLEASKYLQEIISISKKGATYHQLTGYLARFRFSPEQIHAFLQELFLEKVLISDLQQPVSGPESLSFLINRLKSFPIKPEAVKPFIQLKEWLKEPLMNHQKVLEFFQIDVKNEQKLFHANLHYQASQNSISKKVIKEVNDTLNRLLVLNHPHVSQKMEEFKQNFYKRFEEQEVPFLLAMDVDMGIGYGKKMEENSISSSWQDKIDIASSDDNNSLEWTYWKDFVLTKYSHAIQHGHTSIELTEQDLEQIGQYHVQKGEKSTLATVFGSFVASSANELDKGNYAFNLNFLAGPSGVHLLTRFCHGNKNLQDEVQKVIDLEQEKHPEVIMAEVVHCPNEKENLICSRPRLRKYEIPFFSRSTSKTDHQISLQDLTIQVQGGKHVILRSKKHNKRVIPRITTAHNFHRGHHIYRFLGDLQNQEQALNVSWHWSILEKQPYLPRVTYRKVILSRATWNIVTQDFFDTKNKEIQNSHFKELLKSLPHFPRFVLLAEGDNELFIDINSHACIDLLKEAFYKKEIVVLKECLQQPDQCFLQDKEGAYVHEVILPFVKCEPKPYLHKLSETVSAQSDRHLSLGSEWIYLKLYTGERTADKVISHRILPLVNHLFELKLIDEWFFIRFRDPDFHLRVRFHASQSSSDRYYTELLPKVYEWSNDMLATGEVSNVQQETYRRELERYGRSNIQLCEKLFCYDSQSVAAFLEEAQSTMDDSRWMFAFHGVNQLMTLFELSMPDKLRIMHGMKSSFFREFEVDKATKRQMDINYRNQSEALFYSFKQHLHPTLQGILNNRMAHMREIVPLLQGDHQAKDSLLTSFIHMFINRLFTSNQRERELLVYYYLHKFFQSQIKRGLSV